MTSINIILLVTCAFMISAGQLLLKLAATTMPALNETQGNYSFIFNLHLILGLAIYFAATLLWIYLLRTIPLNVAYPVISLAFVFVPLMSAIFIGESLNSKILLGSVFIIIGIIVTVK